MLRQMVNNQTQLTVLSAKVITEPHRQYEVGTLALMCVLLHLVQPGGAWVGPLYQM